jgi:hypothetical protein
VNEPGRMDGDTAVRAAGLIRLLRRAAELVWAAVDAHSAGSPRQVLGLGIDLAADDGRNTLQDAVGRLDRADKRPKECRV